MQASAQRRAEFATWQVAGDSPVIVYSRAALHQVAVDAFEAFQAFSPGGYEIGGVLFGTADEEEVRITAARPIPCEHRFGPEFVLSTQDEASMQFLLETYRRDRALEGLTPVGWYRSRSSGGVELTDSDLQVWNRFFPEPWQVTLVLRPTMDEPVKGGFFYRPRGGGAVARKARAVFDASLLAPVPVETLEPGGSPVREPALTPPEELYIRPKPRRRKVWWVAALGGALLTVGFSTYLYVRPEPAGVGVVTPRLNLRVVEQGGELLVEWDGNSEAARTAVGGRLEIQDDHQRFAIPLNDTVLRLGRWSLARWSGDVMVRLEVETPLAREPLMEVARFLGRPHEPGEAAAGAAGKGTDPKLEQWRVEAAKLQQELAEVAARNRRIEDEVKSARRRLEAARAAETKTETAATTTVATRVAPPVAAEPVSAPPAVTPAPAPAPAPAVALPAAEPERRSPAYNGPRSGKLIWTGVLAPGATLTVEGRRASAGTFSGALPGVNVRVSVYPAELSAGGLTVYSGAARHAQGDVTEPRSAQNGWLNTTYRYDPARAQEVALVEAPSAADGYRKLVVRGGRRPLSALVIAWEVVD
jgi:hypothetical protein